MKYSKGLLRRFAGYYRPHLRLFSIDMLCAFCVAALELVFPLMTRYILQDVIPARDLTLMAILIGVLVLLYVLVAAFTYFINYWGHVVGIRMEASMREDLFSHMQTLSFKFYDGTRTGQLMSRMINDLNGITELAHHGPEDVFLSVVMLSGSISVLFFVEWRLAVAMLVFIPIMVWFAVTRRGAMSSAFREVREKIADVNAQLENSISGNRVVQAFTNQHFEIRKFNEGNDLFKRAKYWAYRQMAGFMTGLQFLTNMLNVGIVAFGGYLIYSQVIDVADLLAFILYINLILQPIRRLTNFTQQFEQGMTGFQRFIEVMDEEPEIVDTENAKPLNGVVGTIEFKDVTFSYDDKEHVLKGIDLRLDAGRTLALVGPSGGGKTTLCNLIPRFYEVNAGEITIDGIDIRDVTLQSLRKEIGMVQQDVFLFTGTIRDNILYGKVDANEEEVIDAAKRANIWEFIQTLPEGLDTYIGEKGLRLSGGQKQRVAIARAFLKNPPILILDEATSSLDNETEIKIQAALEDLAHGRTTLVIAHRLSTIKNADQIVVLTDDGIVERGSHEQLMEFGGIYTGLYDAQFKGYVPDSIEESSAVGGE